MAVVVIRRATGYTVEIDGHTTHLSADQAHDLGAQLRELSAPTARTVTPAKWRRS